MDRSNLTGVTQVNDDYEVENNKYSIKRIIRTSQETEYVCDCDCGKKGVQMSLKAISSSEMPSCGCYGKRLRAEKFSLDLTGQRFGRLVAVKLLEKKIRNYRLWLCKCDCGKMKEATVGQLRSGNTKSCGLDCRLQEKRKYSATASNLEHRKTYWQIRELLQERKSIAYIKKNLHVGSSVVEQIKRELVD